MTYEIKIDSFIIPHTFLKSNPAPWDPESLVLYCHTLNHQAEEESSEYETLLKSLSQAIQSCPDRQTYQSLRDNLLLILKMLPDEIKKTEPFSTLLFNLKMSIQLPIWNAGFLERYCEEINLKRGERTKHYAKLLILVQQILDSNTIIEAFVNFQRNFSHMCSKMPTNVRKNPAISQAILKIEKSFLKL
jgi:hypothetical protein